MSTLLGEVQIQNELGIRETVCTLLEGGVEAFKDRENRYSIPK